MQETPMLFPMAPAEFWKQIKSTIEEVVKANINQTAIQPPTDHLPEKALLKASDVCAVFQEYVAIGFKNNAGGYELRNDFFKLSSTPKYVTYIDNSRSKNSLKNVEHKTENLVQKSTFDQPKISDQNINSNTSMGNQISKQNLWTKQAKSIAVFEGFFDFLSWQTIHQNQRQPLTNFLILNSLSFFERSLLLMEKHEHINLFLDHDTAGRKCVEQALKRSVKYKDKSSLYKGYKDMNDWLMHFGKLENRQSLKQSKG